MQRYCKQTRKQKLEAIQKKSLRHSTKYGGNVLYIKCGKNFVISDANLNFGIKIK